MLVAYILDDVIHYSGRRLFRAKPIPADFNPFGAPRLNWHTLRRTHATLLQAAGGSLKEAQAQLGHSQLSTTLQVYTLPMPAHQREAVEKLSRMVTNGDEFQADAEEQKDAVLSIQ